MFYAVNDPSYRRSGDDVLRPTWSLGRYASLTISEIKGGQPFGFCCFMDGTFSERSPAKNIRRWPSVVCENVSREPHPTKTFGWLCRSKGDDLINPRADWREVSRSREEIHHSYAGGNYQEFRGAAFESLQGSIPSSRVPLKG